METECNCDFCTANVITIKEFRRQMTFNVLVKPPTYQDWLIFIIAKHGMQYYSNFLNKINEYHKSILDDAPFPYIIFNDDLQKGCHIKSVMLYRNTHFINSISNKIVVLRLSITTIKQLINEHDYNINIDTIFYYCVSYDSIDYFQYFIEGFPEFKDSLYGANYTQDLLTLNTGKQLQKDIYQCRCSIYGKSIILNNFKYAKIYGKFTKSAIVYDNYEKIIKIITQIP